MNRKINSLIAAAALGPLVFADAAFGQGTAFTYQGRLQDGAKLSGAEMERGYCSFISGNAVRKGSRGVFYWSTW